MLPQLIHMRCPFGGLKGCPNLVEVEWLDNGVYRASGCSHVELKNGDKEWKAILLLGAVQQMILDAWERTVESDIARSVDEART